MEELLSFLEQIAMDLSNKRSALDYQGQEIIDPVMLAVGTAIQKIAEAPK